MKKVTLDRRKIGGRIDVDRVEDTSDQDVIRQMAEDERDSLKDTAKFATRVRRKFGFSKAKPR